MGHDLQLVDIHIHILPGLDDGPRVMDESLRMCELCVEESVAAIVATPHMCDARYAVCAADVRNGVMELSHACRERGIDVEILPGGDVRLQPELLQHLESGQVLTLADTGRYLLLELPTEVVPPIEGLVFELAVRGITVILSHPERNLEFCRDPDRLGELVEGGCLAQVTGDSLLGRFGRTPRRTAEKFINAGLVHVVASDAHSPTDRRPGLGKVFGKLRKSVGEDVARRLLCDNPQRIVHGESLVAD